MTAAGHHVPGDQLTERAQQPGEVAKGAVRSTTTLDNYVGLLEGAVIENIDEFLGPHCDEVKGDLGKWQFTEERARSGLRMLLAAPAPRPPVGKEP